MGGSTFVKELKRRVGAAKAANVLKMMGYEDPDSDDNDK